MYVQYMYAIHVQMGVVSTEFAELNVGGESQCRSGVEGEEVGTEVMCGGHVWRLCEEVERRQGLWQWICVEVVCGGCVWRSCEEVVHGGWVRRLGEEVHHQRLRADLFVIPNGWEQQEQVFETLREGKTRGGWVWCRVDVHRVWTRKTTKKTLLPVPGTPRDLSLLSWLQALEGGGGSQAEEQCGDQPVVPERRAASADDVVERSQLSSTQYMCSVGWKT
ncbi:hypothetical protein B0H14DRAFT_2576650 [Mycena olivaceomarginata]|nr:hypothetical protein B0H14DRAFT_2576650 [Mycena olivaceomarginata]